MINSSNKPEAILTATKVRKVFLAGTPSEVRAVDGVSLTVNRGEVVLIMGPSGSGKTTLVTLLGGLARPTDGTVVLSGTDITKLSEDARTEFRRTHIGFVFQTFHLLASLTARENVEVVYRLRQHSPADSRNKADALLKRLGLSKRLHAFPAQLSGGEKQRVSIARALANEPELIFADEPTANLDSKTGHEVMRLLCEIACLENRSVVVVSHDERLRDVAGRILHIEDGCLSREESGGHELWCRHHGPVAKS